jgi:hypothetical protein
VQIDPIRPTLKAPEKNMRLKRQYGQLLSSFAFNFNLHHYSLPARSVSDALYAYAKLFNTKGMAMPRFNQPEMTAVVRGLLERCETVACDLSPSEAADALWAGAYTRSGFSST